MRKTLIATALILAASGAQADQRSQNAQWELSQRQFQEDNARIRRQLQESSEYLQQLDTDIRQRQMQQQMEDMQRTQQEMLRRQKYGW